MTMPQPTLAVQLSIKEIYGCVCDRCKKRIHDLVKEKVSDQMVEQVIGADPNGKEPLKP